MPALTNPPHEVFAQHYTANGYNSHKAAVASGLHPNAKNYAPIKARIAELMEQQFAVIGVDAIRVKEELARVAFADVRGLFNADGSMKHITDMDDETAATIAAVDIELKSNGKDEAPTTVVKVKRHDKMAALKILAQHFKIIGDDNDGVNALANALSDRLNAAKRRMFDTSGATDIVQNEGVQARGSTEPTPVDLAPPARYLPPPEPASVLELLPKQPRQPTPPEGDLW